MVLLQIKMMMYSNSLKMMLQVLAKMEVNSLYVETLMLGQMLIQIIAYMTRMTISLNI